MKRTTVIWQAAKNDILDPSSEELYKEIQEDLKNYQKQELWSSQSPYSNLSADVMNYKKMTLDKNTKTIYLLEKSKSMNHVTC